MIGFVLFAICFVVFIVTIGLYLFINKDANLKLSTIPGPPLLDKKHGHLKEIVEVGSLFEFLQSTHAKFGSIVRFYMGGELVVSLGSASLVKQIWHLFDRPPFLFTAFQPMVGPESIQFANGQSAMLRHTRYSRAFSYENCMNFLPAINRLGNEFLTRWAQVPQDQHVCLQKYSFALALKSIALVVFDDSFNSDENVFKLGKLYDHIFWELNGRMIGRKYASAQEESAADVRYESALKEYHCFIDGLIERRKMSRLNSELTLLCDSALDSGFPEEEYTADLKTFFLGGFHTTGNALAWLWYHIAANPVVQQKIHDEVMTVLGATDPVSPDNYSKLVYLRQATDESFRWCNGAYAARVNRKDDMVLGGHTVTKDTPIMHLIGYVHMNETHWAEPLKFDPDRFSPCASQSIATYAFQPFGGAGKRLCPGYRLGYLEVITYTALVCRRFKLHLVDGQTIRPQYGFVTKPQEDIWVTLEKR